MSTLAGETIATYSFGETTYNVVRSNDGYHVIDVDRNLDLSEGEPFASQPLAADVMPLADANEAAWAADEPMSDSAAKAA